jgi:ABC-type molybdenum transport system ATPase subunit/photorepair protein PhrA
MDKTAMSRRTFLAKSLVNEPMMFILDSLETSSFDSLVILGKINKVDAVFENSNKNTISWEIEQQIIL